MKSNGALAPGSARVSRAGYGVSPQRTSFRAAWAAQVNENSAMAETPSSARETRELPGKTRIGNV
jgi:hypothetical protein